MRRDYEIELRWVAFPLRPETPEEGISIEKLLSDRGVNPVQAQAHLEQVAEEEGLPFGRREKTYNSRLAQELGKWAEFRGMGDQFHDTVFRACLVEGRNISKVSVLVDLAESLGLPPKEAEKVLKTRAFRESVDKDWMHSQAMRIRMVPTLAVNGITLVGAQKSEKMEQFMGKGGIKKNTPDL